MTLPTDCSFCSSLLELPQPARRLSESQVHLAEGTAAWCRFSSANAQIHRVSPAKVTLAKVQVLLQCFVFDFTQVR